MLPLLSEKLHACLWRFAMQYLSGLYAVLFIALIFLGCTNEAPVSSDLAAVDGEALLLTEEAV